MLSNKALAISGSISGSAVAGIGIAYLTDNSKALEPARENTPQVSTKKLISSLLNENNRVLLEAQAGEGANNGSTFKSKYFAEQAPVDPGKISNGTAAFASKDVSEDLKKRCEENSKKEVENTEDTLYIAVKDYCTKDKPTKQAGDV